MIQFALARIWRGPLIGRPSAVRAELNRRVELNQRIELARQSELKRRIYNIFHV